MAVLWACCVLWEAFLVYGLFEDDAGIEVRVEFVKGVI